MHVEDAHKHRELDAVAVQILVFIHFLEGHDGAVDTRHHGIGVVSLEIAARRAEEVDHEQEEDGRNDNEDDGYHFPLDEKIGRDVDDKQDE